jgi:hypothetical protein
MLLPVVIAVPKMYPHTVLIAAGDTIPSVSSYGRVAAAVVEKIER